MSIHDKIFDIQDIDSTIDDLSQGALFNWSNSRFKKYPLLSSKAKGKVGEHYVEGYMKHRFKSTVCPSDNTDYDRIIDGKKVEIKFGLATSPSTKATKSTPKMANIKINNFVFNHIALLKEWDILIFCGVNPNFKNPKTTVGKLSHLKAGWDEVNMYFMKKRDFIKYMRETPDCSIFASQQGGKGSHNDDYMVSGANKFEQLIKLPFVKPISQWRKYANK